MAGVKKGRERMENLKPETFRHVKDIRQISFKAPKVILNTLAFTMGGIT